VEAAVPVVTAVDQWTAVVDVYRFCVAVTTAVAAEAVVLVELAVGRAVVGGWLLCVEWMLLVA
jgi:hypothetical protein